MRIALFALVLCALPLSAAPVEFGVQFDVFTTYDLNSRHLDRITSVNIPSANHLYLLWFPKPRLSIGPIMTFNASWVEGSDALDGDDWNSRVGTKGAYYLLGRRWPCFYFEGELAGSFHDGEHRETIVGGGIGYQWPRRQQFVWRLAANYQRWHNTEISLFSISVSLGRR